MKNISKKFVVVIMIIMLLITIAGIEVKAVDDNTVTMSLSTSDKLVAGNTVSINVDFKKSNSSGICSVLGTLSYDANVLEYTGTTSKSDWNTNYAASTKKLGVERNNKTTTTGTIATITFKVKDSITVQSTTISYNIYDVSLGENVDIKTSVTLTADKSTSSDGTYTPADTNNTPNNEKQNTPVNTAKNQIKSSKTTAKRILNAGDTTTIIIASVVAIVAIVGCLGFIKYAKNKDIK